MHLEMKLVRPGAVLPQRATADAAGLDLCACIEDALVLEPGEQILIPTGVAVALPTGTVGLLCGRSGLGVKHRITLSNCVGVIDCDYRGELQVGLCNYGKKAYRLLPGERVAQLLVVPVLFPEPMEVTVLEATGRGEQGFGSTGR